jgi:dipeptide/tripeptide permease
LAFGFLIVETFRLDKIARERMFVVLILTFFSMLFWSFFEQAGSSLNNFTDRNVDRVLESRVVTEADVGKTLSIQPTQEQLGFNNGGKLFTLTDLDALRADNKAPDFQIDWVVGADNIGMGIAERNLEIPASTFQALNAIFILIFGLPFTALWAVLGKRGIEPSTPVKFSLGLFQLGMGFACFWYGAASADSRGISMMAWLALGYLFQTTGELCLSPVGLSMVVRLSPARLVSTVMGSWFLASAFAQFLAAIIAQFTGVEVEEGAANVIPAPTETINIYGEVFGNIAIAAAICGAICLVLSPLLSKWQHEKQPMEGAEGKSAGH